MNTNINQVKYIIKNAYYLPYWIAHLNLELMPETIKSTLKYLNFHDNPVEPVSDILKLHSEHKFNARYEFFSGTKTHEIHVSHCYKQFSRTCMNTCYDFYYGR